MSTLLILVLIISPLILIHELGHFLAARRAGVKVEEFGIGIPPKLYGKKIKGTIYSINLLPFGGFVRLLGEDSFEEKITDKKNFWAKTPRQRFLILIAGVVMNFVLALALFQLFFVLNGFKSLTIPVFFDYDFRFGQESTISTVVTALQEDSAALELGVESGEAIIEIGGVPVYNIDDVRGELEGKVGVEVSLLLMDVRSTSRELRTVKITPKENEEGRGVIGVLLSDAVVISYEKGIQKFFASGLHSANILMYMGHTFSELVNISYEEKSVSPVSDSVSGPVGVFSIVSAILGYQGKDAILGLIDLTAILSLSLGILNLLPIPALDGGRLVFVVVEVVRGKRINPMLEAALHRWGTVFLLALMVLVTIKDITNIIG